MVVIAEPMARSDDDLLSLPLIGVYLASGGEANIYSHRALQPLPPKKRYSPTLARECPHDGLGCSVEHGLRPEHHKLCSFREPRRHTHTHTHTEIYIYICI